MIRTVGHRVDLAIRRFFCRWLGHRWDKDAWACIDYPNNRCCTRCWQLQLSRRVGEDGFRWEDYK